MQPLSIITDWITAEKNLGSTNPDRVVLATTTKNIPHSRIVAIREINESGILFFTQRASRKVAEIKENPTASMTLWLPLQQRQVILEGYLETLTEEDNRRYWQTLPRDRQLRFAAYAPTSGQPIDSISEIENKLQGLTSTLQGKDIPMSDCYCGFRMNPEVLFFYTLGSESFSEVFQYTRAEETWIKQLLSP